MNERPLCCRNDCDPKPAVVVLVLFTDEGPKPIPLCMSHMLTAGEMLDALAQEMIFSQKNDDQDD